MQVGTRLVAKGGPAVSILRKQRMDCDARDRNFRSLFGPRSWPCRARWRGHPGGQLFRLLGIVGEASDQADQEVSQQDQEGLAIEARSV